MKFGKNMIQVVELSDPEWGPFWINYKYLKKKIKHAKDPKSKADCEGDDLSIEKSATTVSNLAQDAREVEFFKILHQEVTKASDFFARLEALCEIRKTNVTKAFNMVNGYRKLLGTEKAKVSGMCDSGSWGRLLSSCVQFYKDVLLVENFAIMNYCAVSKILKKHDKLTGTKTREPFMRNVMSQQNFTHYPGVMDLLRSAEGLFDSINGMDSVMPINDEERIFIAAMRDLNEAATRLQDNEANDHMPVEQEDSKTSSKNNNVGANSDDSSNVDGTGDSSGTAPMEEEKDDNASSKELITDPAKSPSSVHRLRQGGDNKKFKAEALDEATNAVIKAASATRHYEKLTASPTTLVGWVKNISDQKSTLESTGEGMQGGKHSPAFFKKDSDGDSTDASNHSRSRSTVSANDRANKKARTWPPINQKKALVR